MRARLLHDLLSQSAERAPGAAAVRFQEQALSYGDLEARSNQLARALVMEGVSVGDPVVLHAKKSPDAIVALIAILKSGACCVPVDPGTPAPRLRSILDQCRARVAIDSPEARGKLASAALAGSSIERLVGRHQASAQSPEPPATRVSENDLAYILFTSGSTGQPKGVMLSHLSVRIFVDWAVETFAVSTEDRLTNHAPLNFDLSTFDIFGALAAGASVSLVPEGQAMFPVRLADLIERDRITVWYSVPSVLMLLVEHGGLAARDLTSLRLVLFAGEVFPVKYLRELMEAVPGPRYFNLYGPTETNVCTYHEVMTAPAAGDPPVPIGKACEGTNVVALDQHGHPVERPGQEGVLYVGGPSVMAGYYGRPEETEAAFIADPSEQAERLYATGDWVTIDEDGNYVFLGRRDQMIKSAGHRIELGEIEAALYSHPQIREAVAVPVPDELLGSTIKAVVVPVEQGALDAQAVRRHCGSRLPRYMVPTEVELRSELPRTTTQKIDRARLALESASAGTRDG